MNRMLHGMMISGLALAAALAAAPARAALGEPETSVSKDREALAAVARGTTDRGTYTVHELEQGATTIREYVSPQGVVFAVTWSGLANPDLRTLLGGYAAEYEQAAADTPRVKGRRARRVAAPHVVVDAWGHMRDRHGRAYAPELVPQGVSLDEIL
jgi:hypothetical protein